MSSGLDFYFCFHVVIVVTSTKLTFGTPWSQEKLTGPGKCVLLPDRDRGDGKDDVNLGDLKVRVTTLRLVLSLPARGEGEEPDVTFFRLRNKNHRKYIVAETRNVGEVLRHDDSKIPYLRLFNPPVKTDTLGPVSASLVRSTISQR